MTGDMWIYWLWAHFSLSYYADTSLLFYAVRLLQLRDFWPASNSFIRRQMIWILVDKLGYSLAQMLFLRKLYFVCTFVMYSLEFKIYVEDLPWKPNVMICQSYSPFNMHSVGFNEGPFCLIMLWFCQIWCRAVKSLWASMLHLIYFIFLNWMYFRFL